MKNIYLHSFFILLAALFLFLNHNIPILTEADYESHLLNENKIVHDNFNFHYLNLTKNILEISTDQNTVNAFREFNQALDQFDPVILADVEGLQQYFQETNVPWLINQDPQQIENQQNEEQLSTSSNAEIKVVNAHQRSLKMRLNALFPSSQISAKLQNYYIRSNPYNLGQHYLFSGNDDLHLSTAADPGLKKYAEIHNKFHPIFYEFVSNMNAYDVLLVSPEDRLGRKDSRIIYSAMKEIDFATNLTQGPMNVTYLAKAYQAAKHQPKGKVFLTDFQYYLPSGNIPAQFMSTAVYDGDQFIGVIIIQIRINDLINLLSSYKQDKFYQSFADDPDQTMVTNEYHKVVASSNDSIQFKNKQSDNELSLINLDESGTIKIANYNNVKSLTVFSPLKIENKNLTTDFKWRISSELPLASIENKLIDSIIGALKPVGYLFGVLGFSWLMRSFWKENPHIRHILKIRFSTFKNSLKGRLILFFLLVSLLAVLIAWNAYKFNVERQQLFIELQNKTLLTQLESVYFNALALRLNTNNYLFSNMNKEVNILIKDGIETLLVADYDIIQDFMDDQSLLPQKDLREQTRPLAELRLTRNQLFNQLGNIQKVYDEWKSLTTVMTLETGRQALRHPEMENLYMDVDYIFSKTFITAQQSMLGLISPKEVKDNINEFKINVAKHFAVFEKKDIKINEMQRIRDSIFYKMDQFSAELDSSYFTFNKLENDYDAYLSILEAFMEKFNLQLSPLAKLKTDFYREVIKNTQIQGMRNFLRNDEIETINRDEENLKGNKQNNKEMLEIEKKYSKQLLLLSKNSNEWIRLIYQSIQKEQEFLETILKKNNEADISNSIFKLKSHLIEDALEVGDIMLLNDAYIMNVDFFTENNLQHEQLLKNLKELGYEQADEFLGSYKTRKRLAKRLSNNHKRQMDMMVQYKGITTAYFKKLEMNRIQYHNKSIQEVFQKYQLSYPRYIKVQISLFVAIGILGIMFMIYLFKKINKWNEYTLNLVQEIILGKKLKLNETRLLTEMEPAYYVLQLLTEKGQNVENQLEHVQQECNQQQEINQSLEELAKIAEERKLDSQVVKFISAGMLVVDHENRVIQTNPAFLQMFQLHSSEVGGQLLTMIKEGMLDIAILKNNINAVRQTGRSVFNVQCEFEHQELGKMYLRISIVGQEEEEIKELEKGVFFITLENITEQEELKQNQLVLQESQADLAYQAGMNEMSMNVMHNIGNATGSALISSENMDKLQQSLDQFIVMFQEIARVENIEQIKSELLETTETLSAFKTQEFSKSCKEIHDGLDYIREIVRVQQQTVSGGREGNNATRFDIEEIIKNCIFMQEKSNLKYGIQLESNVAEDVRMVILPKNQMVQLLDNLIRNSREAIIERLKSERISGKITIEVRKGRHNQFIIKIEDNGCGIAPGGLKDVFKHGYSTKARGTGFGLHSVANFVQSIGGTIEAMSDGKNMGAAFEISLTVEISKEF